LKNGLKRDNFRGRRSSRLWFKLKGDIVQFLRGFFATGKTCQQLGAENDIFREGIPAKVLGFLKFV